MYDALQIYHNQLDALPSTNQERNAELAQKFAQTGDNKYAKQLCEANLRLVVAIAKPFWHRGKRTIQFIELIQAGNYGLMKAVKKFDPKMGNAFTTYAAFWIRSEIFSFIISQRGIVNFNRATRQERKLFWNCSREVARLKAEGCEDISAALAEKYEMDISDVQKLIGMTYNITAAANVRCEMSKSVETIAGDCDSNQHALLAEQETVFEIRAAVEKFRESLTERDQVIFDSRIFNEEPATLQDLADRFSLSRERVRQLEDRVKKKFKDATAELYAEI